MLLALRARGFAPLLRTTSAACSRCHHVAAKVRAGPACWLMHVHETCSLDEVCSNIEMHSLQAPFLRAQRRPLSGQAFRQSAPTAQRLQNAREELLSAMLCRRFR